MSTPRTSIAFHTMGCKTNFSETSTISSEMLSHGYKKVSYKDKADIYVLNTCSVTENADKEARKLIRQARRLNPVAKIAVIGCYVNGPGESKAAHVGLTGANPKNLIYIDGKPDHKLSNENLVENLEKLIRKKVKEINLSKDNLIAKDV